MWLSVLINQSKLLLGGYNIYICFNWLINSVGMLQTWLSILINHSKLYLSVYDILCLFDWLISSVGVH